MKALLFSTLVCFMPLQAQTTSSTTSTTTTTTTPAPVAATAATVSNPAMERVLSSLTPDEKNEVIAARNKAMAGNPALQTEEMNLMEKGMMLQSDSATPEDREAFRAALKDHVEKVRAAMLKVDPAIEPILAKVEAQGAKMSAGASGSP